MEQNLGCTCKNKKRCACKNQCGNKASTTPKEANKSTTITQSFMTSLDPQGGYKKPSVEDYFTEPVKESKTPEHMEVEPSGFSKKGIILPDATPKTIVIKTSAKKTSGRSNVSYNDNGNQSSIVPNVPGLPCEPKTTPEEDKGFAIAAIGVSIVVIIAGLTAIKATH